MVEFLKKSRENAHLTQTETADLLNISRTYYCLIENGQKEPSPNLAKKIGSMFNFPWFKLIINDAELKDNS